jgi:hypothetical protein
MFESDADWKLRCLDCFRRRKREQERAEHETWQQHQQRRREEPHETLAREAVRLVQEAYLAGKRAGATETQPTGLDRLDRELLRDIVALTHPDRHPKERFELANRVTAAINEILEERRSAA